MKIVSYLVRRELNEPTGLIVAKALPKQDDTLEVSFTIGRVSEADRFGKSLFIHYSDSTSGADLIDIILPNMTDELMDELLAQGQFSIFDTQYDREITFHAAKEAVL